jgi:Fe-S cluster assembly protein SufD
MKPAADRWQKLRSLAESRATALGLPTRSLEAWRYVDCAPLSETFAAAEIPAIAISGDRTNWDITALDALSETDSDALVERWSGCLEKADDLGAVWSLAKLHDGLRLQVAKGEAGVLHLALANPQGDHGRRIVIEVARGAAATLVIDHQLGSARSCSGIEVDLADGAQLRVEERQHGADDGQLLSAVWVHQQRDSQLTWTSTWHGGSLVRARLKSQLLASGASLDLAGLARLDGKRQAHQYLRVEHRGPDTTSRQLVKNIIDGQAKASFDGLVHVASGADRSDAEQTNHNLLLSAQGRADTRPQLDIFADDVKAAHGATVGRPEDEEITYLRTRGLDLATARRLVQQGFSDEILNRFRHDQPA